MTRAQTCALVIGAGLIAGLVVFLLRPATPVEPQLVTGPAAGTTAAAAAPQLVSSVSVPAATGSSGVAGDAAAVAGSTHADALSSDTIQLRPAEPDPTVETARAQVTQAAEDVDNCVRENGAYQDPKADQSARRWAVIGCSYRSAKLDPADPSVVRMDYADSDGYNFVVHAADGRDVRVLRSGGQRCVSVEGTLSCEPARGY